MYDVLGTVEAMSSTPASGFAPAASSSDTKRVWPALFADWPANPDGSISYAACSVNDVFVELFL